MEQDTKSFFNAMNAKKNKMISLLHKFCEINSGTENRQGLNTLLDLLKGEFAPYVDSTDILSFSPIPLIDMQGNHQFFQSGNALFLRKRPHLKRRVLLCGHMDTVYPIDSSFQTLRYLDKNIINGPGVADMKGGLIIMLYALKAFEELPASSTLGWDVFINADEEIGSPASSSFYEEVATNYQAALVYEPAMTPTGHFAKNRRGSGKITLIAAGKSAHVGRAFDQGRNAICYLAEAITLIHALNGKREGVTINVGKIAGGTAVNVVPDKAIAKLDIRIINEADQLWVKDQLDKIIQHLKKPDYELTVEGDFNRPPKQIDIYTKNLFQRIQSVGKTLNLHPEWQDSGGCCDGNNLAKHHIPVIDTLGVRGGNIHSEQEYILLDSLAERATLSALLLNDLAQGNLEKLGQQ